jgi:hypothetical protein
MSEFSNQQMMLVASGLKLIYELFRTLDKTLLLRALRKPVPIPHINRVPCWRNTEAFITANPDFLKTDEWQVSWDTRDQVQSRVRLMVGVARALRRRETEGFYLFAPEVRENAALQAVVISTARDLQRVLQDQTLSEEEKTGLIVKILEGKAQ